MSMGRTPAAGPPVVAPDRVQLAHARLLHDHSFQFDFPGFQQPGPPPGWLVALGKLIVSALPVLKWFFWIALAAGLVFVLVFLAREFLLFRKPPGRAKPATLSGMEEWRPTPAKAKALLEDADRLAAQGRFAEAAHILLFRSIDDIQARRPRLIAPSLTSRDIAGLEGIPAQARSAFALIARHVERSLFGGRSLDAEAFRECRSAYSAFAFPDVWAGRGGGQ